MPPRSYLLLEMQTMKPLELLDEGLTLHIDLYSAVIYRLQVAGPSLVSACSMV